MRISVFFVLLMVVACTKPIPRRPISHHGKSFIEESIARNKKVNELEKRAIKYYIAQDSSHNYLESPRGFWYRYVHQINENAKVPKTSDKVTYRCQISNLKNEILYSFDDLGNINYSVDKEEVELGLQSGIKLMKKGEEVVFVFPSFNALGLLGDKDEVGINEPLIYRIQIIEIN
ncbi:gliding motility-associated peptidyl-prolyl isomerase GldI [Urechidicola vernalis]|uniref:Peptidyl-prolyl cis-trans isomerase n=1 Tax=Urechidicola vernalis TaxID=3075600 RepID=A0ABU2Y1U3_9FLAO|nr:gliding motility-associated peptidyl-prolyl isomerase GldI [Urechidicola sp. P050]MDT0552171.1 gliding motility-associated peptidyl-prolyl isomerase GldI [Urechidicola sp. P050]